jgi:putative aldouronate transport system permease protein
MHSSKSTVVFYVFCFLIVTGFAVLCLLPFVLLISGSFSSEKDVTLYGFSLLPRTPTLAAYRMVFQNPEIILTGYKNTIFITAVGTVISLFLTSMTAYVLSRESYKPRKGIAFYFYFTTLFSGGLVATYIFFIRYLGLKDSYLALILPGLLSVFDILILRSFIKAIPPALIESAKMDGAGEFKIYFRIILPLLTSGIATIGLFKSIGYWNDWWAAMLYISSPSKYPLQYVLYDTLMRTQAFNLLSQRAGIPFDSVPTFTMRMAMALIVTGPIILVYPFVQKYFVSGVTIGSVKG